MLGEVLLYLIIEFGLILLLIFAEGFGVFYGMLMLIVLVIYWVIITLASKTSNEEGGIWDIWRGWYKRRMSINVIVFIVATLITFVFPYRPLNIFAVFAALDVLVGMLPGNVVFTGRDYWEWSGGIYILTAIFSFYILFINLFAFSVEAVAYGTSAFVGWVFLGLMGVIILIILLGLTGHGLEDVTKKD